MTLPLQFFHRVRDRWQRYSILWFAVVLLTINGGVAHAQDAAISGNQVDGYPVVLDGQEVFRIRRGIPGMASPQERAAIVNDRLIQLARNEDISPEAIQVQQRGEEFFLSVNDTVLLTIRPEDVPDGAGSQQAIATETASIIQRSIQSYRQARSAQTLILNALMVVVSTVLLLLFFRTLFRLTSLGLQRIKLAHDNDRLNLRVQGVQLLGSDAVEYLLAGEIRLLRLILLGGAFYLYLPFVLRSFPATRSIGDRLLKLLLANIEQLGQGFATYLPKLLVLILIAIATYYVIEFTKLVIIELGRDDAYPWFYPEWIRPTIRLASLLIVAIALVIAAPYLPGFGSPAFQGVSLFVGALFTLGSSSAVANGLSGIILIYTRAFKQGDMIQIGDIFGEVEEKSLFVTRMLTPKQELITIPNASVLNSNVKNFSAITRQPGGSLLLYSTVTLGYDVPWRQIHDVLLQAAQATKHTLAEPRPFILQTALNDYNVAYEVNVYTDRPDLIPMLYSDLHQNIQDYCNQAGIEILSPAYSAIRDGNHSTIPADYLPPDYQAPGFEVRQS